MKVFCNKSIGYYTENRRQTASYSATDKSTNRQHRFCYHIRMLALGNIKKSYGTRLLLDGVSLTVNAGERLALVGPNGAGKTTLFDVITKRVQPDSGDVIVNEGVVIGYLRQEVNAASAKSVLDETIAGAEETAELAERIKRIEASVHELTDARELALLVSELGKLQTRFEFLDGYRLEAESRRILAGLGFGPERIDGPVRNLSGGWLMRVSLARLLLRKPDILLLDEPTNHLDLQSLLWFEEILKGYAGAIILISHDRAFINRTATRVSELSGGQLTHYTGDYDSFVHEREARLELLLASKSNQDRKIAETERFIERFRSKATKARQVQSRIRQLDKVERIELARQAGTVHFSIPPTERCGKEVVTLGGVSKSYGDTKVYSNLEICLQRGDKAALVGENGAGKSTLLKMLAGVAAPDSGRRVLGHNVTTAYFAQHTAETLDAGNTALDEITRAAPQESPTRLRGMLGAFLFRGDDASKKVAVMSGGEKSRLALACMLMRPANLILLDEPTNHLDIPSRDILEDALQDYDGTLCLITHDRHLIRSVANKIIEVRDGAAIVHAMDYDSYLLRKERENAEAGAAPVQAELQFQPGAEPVKKGRAERRAIGEMRNRFNAETREIKRRIEEIECGLDRLQNRRSELEDALGLPETYAGGGNVVAVRAELEGAIEEIARITDEWERLSMELEEKEARFREEEMRISG